MFKRITFLLMLVSALTLVLANCEGGGTTDPSGGGDTTAATWTQLGNGLASPYPHQIDLEVASDGTPYVCFTDTNGGTATNVSVAKYDGSAWALVGGAVISSKGDKYDVDMALDSADTPYVVFADVDNAFCVMKYDGSAWTNVGDLSSYEYTSDVSIVFDNTTPYVLHGKASALTVLSYNGTAWSAVGAETTDHSITSYASLSISSSTPYLAYVQYVDSTRKVVVKKYESGAWTNLGDAFGTIVGAASFLNCAFDSAGTPYVLYEHGVTNSDGSETNYRAIVQKYDGSAWATVGNADFPEYGAWELSLAFDADDTPYVAVTHTISEVIYKLDGSSWVEFEGDEDFGANLLIKATGGSTNLAMFAAYRDGSTGNYQLYVKKYE